MSEQSQALSCLTSRFEKEITQDYGFQLYGSGGSIPVKIEGINLFFKSRLSGHIEEARKLAVEMSLKLIERMNQDEQLKPYMANYPVILKNIDLTIVFTQENKTSQNEWLSSVMVIGSRNKVVYHIYNAEGIVTAIHRETFDEAVKILEQEGFFKK